jgi:hypothetical protein
VTPLDYLRAWWRHLTRDRVNQLLAAHDFEERLRAAFDDDATQLDGWEAWMNDCDPASPCGTRWDNNADRAIWHNCANHPPRGRHARIAGVDATEVISLAEWRERVQ